MLNALDQYGHSRDRDLPREVHTWETFGYTCEELDLRDHFSAPEDLRNRVADFDLVRALGGNAFVLARAMTRSRFADAVKERLNRPSSSTAAVRPVPVFTGPDLRGIDLIDDPAVRPDGYPSGIEPDCLGLVPFRVVPHWRSDHPDAAGADQAAGHLTEAGLQQRCLRDGQTISVQEVSDLAA